jgi:hypothetical protein
MNKYTQILLLFAIMIIFYACKTSNTNRVGEGQADSYEIVGYWKENWGANEKNALKYSDIYQLKITDNRLTIHSIDKKYRFEKISYQNNKLSFTLLNTDQYEKETYTIDYELTFIPKTKTLEGQAKTNKGVIAKVLWFTEKP